MTYLMVEMIIRQHKVQLKLLEDINLYCYLMEASNRKQLQQKPARNNKA